MSEETLIHCPHCGTFDAVDAFRYACPLMIYQYTGIVLDEDGRPMIDDEDPGELGDDSESAGNAVCYHVGSLGCHTAFDPELLGL